MSAPNGTENIRRVVQPDYRKSSADYPEYTCRWKHVARAVKSDILWNTFYPLSQETATPGLPDHEK